jgi:spore germination cell wall hydrolase CwlJ-like protein
MNQVIRYFGAGIVGATLGIAAFGTSSSVMVIESPTDPVIHAVEIVREVEVPALESTQYTRSEQIHLAATMWGEARGDGVRGMRAVGHVILNRVNSDNDQRYGSTLREVMLKDWQFSVWNSGDPNRGRMLRLINGWQPRGRDGEMWLVAQTLAADILTGRSQDPTNGALYYHTQDVDPDWNDHAEGELVLASHIFYQDATR